MDKVSELQQIRDIILQNENMSIECWQTEILTLCDQIEHEANTDVQVQKLLSEIMEMKSRLEFYAPIKGVKIIDPKDGTVGYADLGSLAREYLKAKFGYKG